MVSRIAEAVMSGKGARDASLGPTVNSPVGSVDTSSTSSSWHHHASGGGSGGEMAWRAQPAFFARALSPRVSYATQPLIMNGTTEHPPLWISGGSPYWLGNRALKSTLHHTGHYSPYFINNTK